MPVVLGAAADVAVAAAAKRLACEDAVAEREGRDGGALGDEHAGAFVRPRDGQRDVREGAF